MCNSHKSVPVKLRDKKAIDNVRIFFFFTIFLLWWQHQRSSSKEQMEFRSASKVTRDYSDLQFSVILPNEHDDLIFTIAS